MTSKPVCGGCHDVGSMYLIRKPSVYDTLKGGWYQETVCCACGRSWTVRCNK